MTSDEAYLICVWSNGSWCYSHSLEDYQRDLGLSDDYLTTSVSVCDAVVDVDAYIEDLVCSGSV